MSTDVWNVEDPTACPICHRDSCEDHLPAPTPEAAAPTLDGALRAQRALDYMNAPVRDAIIEDMAWQDSVTVLVSESGAGKSFLLLDVAGAVSDGVTWHGRETQQGSVVYVPYEGTLGLRLRALHHIAGRRLDHLHIIEARDVLTPRLTRDGEVTAPGELILHGALQTLRDTLATTQQPPIVLLIIDTVRASHAGSEDASAEVSAYLRAVRRLLAGLPGAAVILAHHSGWQDGDTRRKRERGSSSWRGNCDGTIYLDADAYNRDTGEARLTVSTLKVRDGEPPAPLHLLRQKVDLHTRDRYGRPVTSCIIDRDRRSPEDRDAEQAQAAAAEHRACDLRTLRVIVDCPDMATSQDRLRLVLGVRKALVADSLSRLVGAGWVTPGGRNQPYQVTETGSAALEAS